jgi:hypothetical protein
MLAVRAASRSFRTSVDLARIVSISAAAQGAKYQFGGLACAELADGKGSVQC